MLLGAHTSTAGGTAAAPPRAQLVGAHTMQIFTKQANRWAERDCDDAEHAAFRGAASDAGLTWICAHDSYLINLASPDPVLRARSIDSFERELRRCTALELDALVSHPGNYMDERASGLARNADAISEVLHRVPPGVRLLMETTAGSGTVLGATFEELASLIDLVDPSVRARVGVCVDTCHVFSSGLDLVGDYDGVWSRFGDSIGFDRLGALHLNDSKTPFASRRDRHELIGDGSLGEGVFRRIMTDPRLVGVPKVIETPKLDDPATMDRRMLELLRSYQATV